ncbi:MAG: hypothetical protein ACYS8Z_13050 [Planctomycetota bacterium]|jgi:YD repeat-containing protein
MKRHIIFGSLVLTILTAGPALARIPFFEAWPSACEAPPYPSLSPLDVGVYVDSVSALKKMARLEMNLKSAIPPTLPLRMTSRNPGGEDFAVESFFDVFFEGADGTFPAESFFDVFFELSGDHTLPGIRRIKPSLIFTEDSFFDVFCEVVFDDRGKLLLQWHAEPLPGTVLGDVRLGNFTMGDSFFDVFVEIDLPGIGAPDFSKPLLTMRMVGDYKPPTLLNIYMEGPGPNVEGGDVYHGLNRPIDANAFFGVNGFKVADDDYDMLCTLSPTSGLQIDKIKRLMTRFGGGGQYVCRAVYNDQGRVVQVEQVGKDANEPNDVFTFDYDDLGRLTEATFMKGGPLGAVMGGISTSDYCDDCPRGLRKRPGRTTYSNYSDPNKDIEISTSYDTNQRMASITYELGEHDHRGMLNFIHDPNGKLTKITGSRDTDQNGSWDAEIVSMTLSGDFAGRIERIYDNVSGSDLLQWNRLNLSADQTEETLMIKPVFGDPNSSVSTMTVTGGTGDSIWAGGDDLNVVMPEEGGSATITNLTWMPGDPMPSVNVSADVNWAPLDGSLGDRRIGNRVILPIIRPDGELVATVDADEMKICSYMDKTRKKGLALGANATSRDEVHFYDMTDSGEIAAMLTMDEYGHAIVSIGGNNEEKATFNFFEAWPSARGATFFEAWPSLKREEEEKSTFNFFECWPSTMRGPSEAMVDKDAGAPNRWEWRRNSYNFFEAWPSAWGAQPYMPIYSETGDGQRYIAGAVTPGGAYSHFQYSPDGELEAIVRMNSVDAMDCTEQIPGDLDGNCKLNFKDFALMALHWLDCKLEHQEACD